jgi:thiamine-phosphate pyrophosphorylase
VLTDGANSLAELRKRITRLVAAGVDIIQLRDKRLPDHEILARLQALIEITRPTTTLAILNDRPDLAHQAAADGVHVGQDDLSAVEAREIIGGELVLGISTHNIQQARQAVSAGADYLGAGPVFPSQTKSFQEFPGIEFLRQVAREISLPVFAIGGITLDNLQLVQAAGIRRIAVSGTVLSASEPEKVAVELRKQLPASLS